MQNEPALTLDVLQKKSSLLFNVCQCNWMNLKFLVLLSNSACRTDEDHHFGHQH